MDAIRLRSDDLSSHEIDGETVILDLRSSRYLKTNRTGTFLLNLLADETSRDELVEQLARSFDIDAGRAGQDVDSFIDELTSRHLLA